jgi:hypothetical protein
MYLDGHNVDDENYGKRSSKCGYRVNVPNLAKFPNWRSLVKTSLELQLCPLFQINRPKNPLGLLPLIKSFNFKEGTRWQLPRHFYQIGTCAKLGTFTLLCKSREQLISKISDLGWKILKSSLTQV